VIAGEIFANINAKHVVQDQLGQKLLLLLIKSGAGTLTLMIISTSTSLAMHVWITDGQPEIYEQRELVLGHTVYSCSR